MKNTIAVTYRTFAVNLATGAHTRVTVSGATAADCKARIRAICAEYNLRPNWQSLRKVRKTRAKF